MCAQSLCSGAFRRAVQPSRFSAACPPASRGMARCLSWPSLARMKSGRARPRRDGRRVRGLRPADPARGRAEDHPSRYARRRPRRRSSRASAARLRPPASSPIQTSSPSTISARTRRLVHRDGARERGASSRISSRRTEGFAYRWTSCASCRQILAALGYAHELGVVHRDSSPKNMFLLADGTVKLADFGIAHSTRPSSRSRTVLGTPAYMSPEQNAAAGRRALRPLLGRRHPLPFLTGSALHRRTHVHDAQDPRRRPSLPVAVQRALPAAMDARHPGAGQEARGAIPDGGRVAQGARGCRAELADAGGSGETSDDAGSGRGDALKNGARKPAALVRPRRPTSRKSATCLRSSSSARVVDDRIGRGGVVVTAGQGEWQSRDHSTSHECPPSPVSVAGGAAGGCGGSRRSRQHHTCPAVCGHRRPVKTEPWSVWRDLRGGPRRPLSAHLAISPTRRRCNRDLRADSR